MAYKAYVTPKCYLETDRGTSIPKSELIPPAPGRQPAY